MIPIKEIALIQKEIKTLPTTPTITNQIELDSAAEVLVKIKGIAKMIDERKKLITAPLMASLASARDLFRPYEEKLVHTETMFKTSILLYTNEVEEKAAKERARILARTEKGTYRPDTAVAKLEGIEDKPVAKGIQTRMLTKIRIVDESLIPRAWLMPNLPAITEAILRAGAEIPGVEKYKEKVLSAARV